MAITSHLFYAFFVLILIPLHPPLNNNNNNNNTNKKQQNIFLSPIRNVSHIVKFFFYFNFFCENYIHPQKKFGRLLIFRRTLLYLISVKTKISLKYRTPCWNIATKLTGFKLKQPLSKWYSFTAPSSIYRHTYIDAKVTQIVTCRFPAYLKQCHKF